MCISKIYEILLGNQHKENNAQPNQNWAKNKKSQRKHNWSISTSKDIHPKGLQNMNLFLFNYSWCAILYQFQVYNIVIQDFIDYIPSKVITKQRLYFPVLYNISF